MQLQKQQLHEEVILYYWHSEDGLLQATLHPETTRRWSLLLQQAPSSGPCVETIVRICRSHILANKDWDVNLIFSVT